MRRKLKIIVLDDNEIIDRLMDKVLSGFDATVTTFTDPFEMLKNVELLRPDVIFVDHGLPGMKGLDVIYALKRKIFPGIRYPKIIGISGWGPELGERMISAGADAFLSKPFGKLDVDAALAAVVSTKLKLP